MSQRTHAAALIATPLALLAALAAAALLALAPAHAGPPPEGVELILNVDDADGVIEPGQTVKISAAVRFPGQYGGAERMKASDLSLRSNFEWENAAAAGGRLNLDDPGLIMGTQNLRPTTAAGGWLTYDFDGMNTVLAMDGRTAVTRDRPTRNVYIFDTWNKLQALIIPPPAGATDGFGCGERAFHNDPDRCYLARPIAVWHETENLAWLFIGEAKAAGPGGEDHVGRLHIYSLDWTTDPPSYTRHGSIQPPLAEAGNHIARISNSPNSTRYWASYGGAVAISADGSTLAVGAPRINQIGAVYIYTRPDGAGQDWSDIAYEDGVKVTVAPTPHWGTSLATGTAPFSGQTCDAICKTQRNNVWNRFAWRHISLSADGRVMAVGAGGTSYYHDETNLAPYPSQSGGTGKWNTGQAYVFVAPDGGWQAAPDVVTGKTVMTAKANAATAYPDYSRATHITPGPNRRITEPTTILRARAWGSASNNWRFGEFITITRDGTTVAAGTQGTPNINTWAGPGRGFIFQVDSPDQWEEIDQPWVHGANPMTGATSAEIAGGGGQALPGYGTPGRCGMAFNGAGDRLVFGLCGAGTGGHDQGEIRYLHRPADGRWVGGAIHQLGPLFVEPHGRNVGNGYGVPIYSLNGERLAVSAWGIKIIDTVLCCRINSDAPGYFFLSDSQCREHRDAEGRTWTTCPIRFPNDVEPTIVVPPGQPEGALTVSGQIKVFMFLGDAGGYTGPSGDDTENAKTLSKTLTLRIGEVAELAEAQLDFAVEQQGVDGGDDRLFPSSLTAGERTVLRLQLLNERGMPAPADAIASIIATTTRGSLSSNIRNSANARISDGCLGGGGDACQIEPTLLSLAGEQARLAAIVPYSGNFATLPPPSYSPDNILLTLEHSGTGGPADVNVRVIAKDGTSLTPETVRVNLLGRPAALSIAAPVGGLLNVGTPDAGVDAEHRDRLTLAVTALDEHGAVVPLPSGGLSRAWLTDPDGRRVARGVDIAWPLGGAAAPTLDAAGARQVRVDVNRAAAQPLANGEYTLSLRIGELSAEQTIRVSGGVAAVALSPAGLEAALDSDFTVTATLTDAQGDPVPDGTPVEWGEVSAVGSAGIVQRSAERVTGGGAASATWRAVSPGRVTVTAAANGLTAVALVTVPAPPQPTAAELLSSGAPNTFAIWNGRSAIRAAALLPELEGVTTLSIWRTGRWFRYGVDRGQLVEGSQNFQILPGNLLWLSN